jgi:hypothetical protein
MKEHCFATDKKLNKKEKEQILIQLGKSNKALELKQKKRTITGKANRRRKGLK